MFDLRRREFITLAGGALAWPLAARRQQRERMRRIGMLLPFVEDDPEAQLRVNALRQTLRELGWAEGQNFSIDYRWTGNNPGHMRSYAKELVGLTPDVIVVNSTLVLAALKKRDQNRANRVCPSPRSSRGRVCREPSASRWKHHGIYKFRIRNGWKMVGLAQRYSPSPCVSDGNSKSGGLGIIRIRAPDCDFGPIDWSAAKYA